MAELDPTATCFDILNFTFEGEGEEDEASKALFDSKPGASASSSSLESSNPTPNTRGLFPVVVEEELEWLLDKDAFPTVESCFGILSDNPELVANHLSPVSVLENSSSSSSNNSNGNGGSVASCCGSFKVPTNHPVRSRSKKRTRKRSGGYDHFSSHHFMRVNQANAKNKQESSHSLPSTNSGAGIGRRCLHCQAEKTPQWRAGPMGPKTLCNACGVRFKSGRLLPEYRPASSPTFSSLFHSNSHRKVVEMRKQNPLPIGGGIHESGARVDTG